MDPKIEALIENLRASNIIRESKSPWCSTIVAVRKSDSQVRMCIDYRKLNSITERPIFPISDAGLFFYNQFQSGLLSSWNKQK